MLLLAYRPLHKPKSSNKRMQKTTKKTKLRTKRRKMTMLTRRKLNPNLFALCATRTQAISERTWP